MMVELKGRIQKDYSGYLYLVTDPPSWKCRKISEKLTNANFIAGQKVKVTIKSEENEQTKNKEL